MAAPALAIALAACSAPAGGGGQGGFCPEGRGVETRVGGSAAMGVNNDGPVSDIDATFSTIIRTGGGGCIGGAATTHSEF